MTQSYLCIKYGLDCHLAQGAAWSNLSQVCWVLGRPGNLNNFRPVGYNRTAIAYLGGQCLNLLLDGGGFFLWTLTPLAPASEVWPGGHKRWRVGHQGFTGQGAPYSRLKPWFEAEHLRTAWFLGMSPSILFTFVHGRAKIHSRVGKKHKKKLPHIRAEHIFEKGDSRQ